MPDSGIRVVKAEEVITLPPPSKGQLNKIVKQRKLEIIAGTEISKVYICLQNSVGKYEWTQIATST